MLDRSMRMEFAYLSSAYAYGGPVQSVGDIVRTLPDFPAMRRMLDLGGATGFFSIAIVTAHPSLKSDVLEQSWIACVITQKFIRQYEVKDRIAVIESDFMKESLRDSYDLIVASAFPKGIENQLGEFFHNVYDALNPGGIFLNCKDRVVTKRIRSFEKTNDRHFFISGGEDIVFLQRIITGALHDVNINNNWPFVRKGHKVTKKINGDSYTVSSTINNQQGRNNE